MNNSFILYIKCFSLILLLKSHKKYEINYNFVFKLYQLLMRICYFTNAKCKYNKKTNQNSKNFDMINNLFD